MEVCLWTHQDHRQGINMSDLSNTDLQIIELSSTVSAHQEGIKGLRLSRQRDRDEMLKLVNRIDKLEKNQNKVLKWINVGWTLLIILWAVVQYFGAGNIIKHVVETEEKKIERQVEKDIKG